MQQVIYILCGLTSLLCAILLFRGHARTGLQLLFWKRSRDRLFALFGAAFLILSAERIILATMHAQNEFVPYVYVIRLLAFVVIIIAIIDKNRRS